MPELNNTQPSFSGGVISTELFSRIDYSKISSGLKRCENWQIRPAGGAEFRTGTKYLSLAKYPEKKIALIPFVQSLDIGYCLEFGHQYIRFHRDTWPVMKDGEPYEILTDYLESEVSELKFAQSKNQLFIVHKNHHPKVLTKLSDTEWTLVNMVFNPTVPKVESVSINHDKDEGTVKNDWTYAVSVVDEKDNEGFATISNVHNSDIELNKSPMIINFKAPSGCKKGYKFYIYRIYRGDYCLIWKINYEEGKTDYSLKDISYAPDTTKVIKKAFNSFDNGNYPSAIGISKQRLIFANTPKGPNTIYASRVGVFDDFTTTPANNDDESFEMELDSNTTDNITDLVPMDDLIIMTQSKIWRVIGTSAKNMSAYIESYSGSSGLLPFSYKKSILYVDSSKNTVSNFVYSYELNGYTGQELDILCREFFDGHEIKSITFRSNPYGILYCVRDDGVLLELTYLREENIYAWHIHTTKGLFESVCCVDRRKNDDVYVVVERNGKKHIEVFMNQIDFDGTADTSWHLDCAARIYTNKDKSISIIDGETHIDQLERFNGQKISVLADGNVFNDILVENGKIVIHGEFNVVLVGLPFYGYIEPIAMDIKFGNGSSSVGINRRINNATIRYLRTRGLMYGTSYNKLFELKPYTQENFGELIPLETGVSKLEVQDTFKMESKFIVAQKNPLPAFLQSITLEFNYGQKN